MEYKTEAIRALSRLWQEEWQLKLDKALEVLPAIQRLIIRQLPEFIDIEGLFQKLDDDPEALATLKRELEKTLALLEGEKVIEEKDDGR